METIEKVTDKEKILRHLMEGNSITFHGAEKLFNGTISLRERIRDLRKEGIAIITRKEKNPETNRWHSIYSIPGAVAQGA